MKASWQRLFALTAVVLLTLTFTTACGGRSTSSSNTGSSDSSGPTEEVAVDLKGYVFTVQDYFKTRWDPDPGKGDKKHDLILALIEDVETTFNCQIEFTELGVNDVMNKVQPAVMAGEKYADLIVTTMWNYGSLMSANLMGDLKQIETVNWDNPWWNQNLMNACTVNGQVLGGAAPFTSHTYLTWSCYYNKAIWNEVVTQKGGPADPYQMVRDGTWTYDKFRQYAKAAMLDRDGDGTVNSMTDRFGMVAPDGDYCRAAFMAMGGRYFATDANGKISLAANSSHAVDVVNFMQGMIKQDKIHDNKLNGNTAFTEIIGSFVNGHALFICCSPGESALKDMDDDFGFLPQPKWNAEQENYIGMVDHNAPIFGITTQNRDLDKVGYIIEAVARRFLAVEEMEMDDWADVIWRDDASDEMMRNFIYNRGGYDIAPILSRKTPAIGAPISIVQSSVFGGNMDYASTMEASAETIQEAIDEFSSGATREPDAVDPGESGES